MSDKNDLGWFHALTALRQGVARGEKTTAFAMPPDRATRTFLPPLPIVQLLQNVAPPVGRGGRGDPAAYLSDAHTSGWCGWSGSVFRLPTFWRTWLRESVRIGTIDKFGACEVDIPRGTDSPRDRGRRSPYAQSGVLPKRHIVGRRYAIIRVRGP